MSSTLPHPGPEPAGGVAGDSRSNSSTRRETRRCRSRMNRRRVVPLLDARRERRARQIIASVFKQTSIDCFEQFSLSFCKESNAAFFAANPFRRRADRRDLLELVDREQRDRVDKRQNRRLRVPPGKARHGERSEPRPDPGGGRGCSEVYWPAPAGGRKRRRKPQWRLNDSRSTPTDQPARYSRPDPPVQYPASYATLEGQAARLRGAAALRRQNRGGCE